MILGKRNKILARVNTKDSGKNKSLIPTFGIHTVMMTNKPKLGIKLLFLPESYSLFPRIMVEFYSLFPYFL